MTQEQRGQIMQILGGNISTDQLDEISSIIKAAERAAWNAAIEAAANEAIQSTDTRANLAEAISKLTK